MKQLKNIHLLILAMLVTTVSALEAKTVVRSISLADATEVNPFWYGIYRCKTKYEHYLLDINKGKKIYTHNDSNGYIFNPAEDGYSLVCDANNRILKILAFDKFGEFIEYPVPHDTKVYCTTTKICEGLLLVKDSNAKYGYLAMFKDHHARLLFPCKYSIAKDFSNGMAAVSIDGYRWGYIDKTSKGKIVLSQDTKCRGFYLAEKFNRYGWAKVYYSDGSSNYINKQGEVAEGDNETTMKADEEGPNKSLASTILEKNNSGIEASKDPTSNKYYLIDGETNEKITGPIFNNSPRFFLDDYILVNQNGQFEMLKVIDGNIDISVTDINGNDITKILYSNNIDNLLLRLSMPQEVKNLNLFLDSGDGKWENVDINKAISGYQFKPLINPNSSICSIRWIAETDDGYNEVKGEKLITIDNPINIYVSEPKASMGEYAAANTVSAVVTNSSAISVTIDVSLSVSEKETTRRITLAPRQSERISLSITVNSRQNATATITAKVNGEIKAKKSENVTLYPPY